MKGRTVLRSRSTVGAGEPGLPGLSVPGWVAGPRPRRLLAPGTLLLAGAEPGRRENFAGHQRRWGALPVLDARELISAAARHEVLGAGGAAFPTDRKLAALAGQRVSHVIVNGAEGETASGKDGVLLAHAPHLVIDGAMLAAAALGARRVVVRLSEERPDLAEHVAAALAERPDAAGVHLSIGPAAFVAGEASAVIRAIAGGPPLPAELGRPPAWPGRVAWRRALVMLSNVETFARLALAAREVAGSSALVSVSGAVAGAGVLELPDDRRLADAALAGAVVGSPDTVITGGWHGRWLPWTDETAYALLTRSGLAAVGGRWGAGALIWLPEGMPRVAALAAVAGELAAGTAGQCGPCWRGLPHVAAELGGLAAGSTDRTALADIMADVDGRGICAHPSAAVAALRSGLALIGERP